MNTKKKDMHVAPPSHSARAAGLHYVRGAPAGIDRRGGPTRFRYLQGGRPVRDKETLSRIRQLAIPPAWQRVWINADPLGHLQATGFDAKGRKQYRYHMDWSAHRNEAKYTHTLAFGKQLAAMRKRVEQDLQLRGLPAEKVLAMVVSVMDHTHIRVGHETYARTNGTFGLSTLLDRHVKPDGAGLRFVFKGKTGIQHNIRLGSARLARLVMRCKELPGQDLFQYLDGEGRPCPIDSGMVNDYIRSISNGEFTSKDMRTWKGTVHCTRALLEQGPAETLTEQRLRINTALDHAAKHLGNTRTVCRKYYVHPEVVVAYESRILMTVAAGVKGTRTMALEERVVLRLLEQGTRRRTVLDPKMPAMAA